VRDHRPFGGIEGLDHLGILDPGRQIASPASSPRKQAVTTSSADI
jgi:hypothetical protein